MNDLYEKIRQEILLDSKELLRQQKENQRKTFGFLVKLGNKKEDEQKDKKDKIFRKKIRKPKRTVWTKEKDDKPIIKKFG